MICPPSLGEVRQLREDGPHLVDLAALPQHSGEDLADSFRNAGVAVQDEQEGRPKSVRPSRIVMQLEDIPSADS